MASLNSQRQGSGDDESGWQERVLYKRSAGAAATTSSLADQSGSIIGGRHRSPAVTTHAARQQATGTSTAAGTWLVPCRLPQLVPSSTGPRSTGQVVAAQTSTVADEGDVPARL